MINPDLLRMLTPAVAFVRAFFEAGKPVAAICHGPWVFVEAGHVRGAADDELAVVADRPTERRGGGGRAGGG